MHRFIASLFRVQKFFLSLGNVIGTSRCLVWQSVVKQNSFCNDSNGCRRTFEINWCKCRNVGKKANLLNVYGYETHNITMHAREIIASGRNNVVSIMTP